MSEEMQRAEHRDALGILESRRLAMTGAMWHAPTLMLVAQAFLLGVLTDETVGWAVATIVALAGIASLVIAGVSLWQQRRREVELSERIEAHAAAVGLPELRRKRGQWSLSRPSEWRTWAVWVWVVFPLFAAADAMALILTR